MKLPFFSRGRAQAVEAVEAVEADTGTTPKFYHIADLQIVPRGPHPIWNYRLDLSTVPLWVLEIVNVTHPAPSLSEVILLDFCEYQESLYDRHTEMIRLYRRGPPEKFFFWLGPVFEPQPAA